MLHIARLVILGCFAALCLLRQDGAAAVRCGKARAHVDERHAGKVRLQHLFRDLLHAVLIVVVDGVGDDLHVACLGVAHDIGHDAPPDIALFGRVEQIAVLKRAHARIERVHHVRCGHLAHIARHIVRVQQGAHGLGEIADRAADRAEQRAAADAGVLRQVQLIRRHHADAVLRTDALQGVILRKALLVGPFALALLAQSPPLERQRDQRTADHDRQHEDGQRRVLRARRRQRRYHINGQLHRGHPPFAESAERRFLPYIRTIPPRVEICNDFISEFQGFCLKTAFFALQVIPEYDSISENARSEKSAGDRPALFAYPHRIHAAGGPP